MATSRQIYSAEEAKQRAIAAKARWRERNPHYIKEWEAKNQESRYAARARYIAKNRTKERPPENTPKTCPRCGANKVMSDFTPSEITRDGRHPVCRVCNTVKKYGMTAKEFEDLWSKHDGKCAICKSGLVRNIKNGFNVDHDHETSIVRGLLCSKCNLAIGQFQDDPRLCLLAAAYLKGKSL